jgi:glucosamine kinase
MTDSGHTFLIGVDGGGSRCRFALADAAGRVLARHEGGASNIASDFATAAETIRQGIDTLRACPALPAGARLVIHLGLAGANAPGTGDRLARHLQLPDLTVEDDRRTAVTGALGGGPGAVASCGTGSFVCRMAGDRLLSVGGWGLALGDDASGAWLGRQALRRAILALDGLLPATGLLRDLAARTGGNQPAMVDFAIAAQPRDYAALAPVVVAAATAGDAEALLLMQQGAAYLRDALKALGHAPGEPLCLLGGVGPHYAAHLPDLAIRPPHLPALSGALMLAARAAGIATGGKPWT